MLRKLLQRFKKRQPSNLELHAHDELLLAGFDPKNPDFLSSQMYKDVMQLVRTFCEQGHSGFSAAYATSIASTLMKYEPLTPLTGADSEWFERDEGRYQNKRDSSVFKDADGKAYDIDAIVIEEADGCRYSTGRIGRQYIDFPYIPKKRVLQESSMEYWWLTEGRHQYSK